MYPLEGALAIASGKEAEELSQQQILSCTYESEKDRNGCNGRFKLSYNYCFTMFHTQFSVTCIIASKCDTKIFYHLINVRLLLYIYKLASDSKYESFRKYKNCCSGDLTTSKSEKRQSVLIALQNIYSSRVKTVL